MTDPDSLASAETAWTRGLAAGTDQLAWLARAARLAPHDPRIALDLARMQLTAGADEAAAATREFAHLAARYDVLPAWLGLAMAHHRQGNAKAAAEALGNLLARHCVPDEPGFPALAARIALAAGYDGFCGMAASGKQLASTQSGKLLGKPWDMPALTRVEGLVSADETGVTGWASRPAAQAAPPKLTLTDSTGRRRAVKFGKILDADDDAPFLQRYGFKLSTRRLRELTPPFSLHGPDGAHISGSPIDPSWLNLPPLQAATRGIPRRRLLAPRKLAVLIPAYRGLEETRACLDSLFAALPKGDKIIVVDDATPEPPLAAFLDKLAAAGHITLCRHTQNQGFPAAANTGFQAAKGRDILLLNSDTLVPPGAIETLRDIAYAHADTGSVTPFSNEATILSYPNPRGGNPMPDLAEATRLNTRAREANGTQSLEIPTGIGFCMYLRHDCLKATGGFRADIFAQGYGEENDWCIRARHLGFTHRAAIGAYVAHIGGVSFRAAALGLTKRNLAILNRLYPGYHEMVMATIAADRLAPARARMDAARLKSGPKQNAVLLISHSHGGGVARQVAAQMAELRAQNLRPLLLLTQFPDESKPTPYPWPALLTEGSPSDYPNLAFTLPHEAPALHRLLQAARVKKIILHHSLGHHPSVRDLATSLNLPLDIVIHDYASFCPRVNLLTRASPDVQPRYCGEPSPSGCADCCSRDTYELLDPTPIPALLARSRREFSVATTITAPSADTARRISRHFPGVKPSITPWENDSLPVSLTPPGTGRRKIVIIGGIGYSKGFDLLLDCAEDATQRRLALDFIVAGSSADDAKLLATGRIFVTGAYAEGQAQPLIAKIRPDLAFLPSIWPETWCFALSEAWRAGLYAIAFDLGAQSERIKTTGRGVTLPLGLPASRINDILLKWLP
jgi:GT2 family glycosyltransferase/glycosyltransferase involved in cell wall biosynthesis